MVPAAEVLAVSHSMFRARPQASRRVLNALAPGFRARNFGEAVECAVEFLAAYMSALEPCTQFRQTRPMLAAQEPLDALLR